MRQHESATPLRPAPPKVATPVPPKAATPPPASMTAAATPSIPPDWLEDIRHIEESLKRPPLPAARAPSPSAPPSVSAAPAAPASPPKEPQRGDQALSVFEVFLAARRRLERWVDADENQALIVAGDGTSVRKARDLQEILHSYDSYGPVMQEKLDKHLAFLVENRRKYYAAFARRA
jgi:hypothetical protein